jgi:siroheme synthase-like protein
VAARKAAALLESGAVVTVVAPTICAAVEALPARIEARRYLHGEARGYRLVVTATGDPLVDHAVYLDAEAAGVLVNAADNPASCSFLMPAVLRRGPVSVAVSTGGVSPFLAGWVRDRIAGAVPPEVGVLAAMVGRARERLRAAGVSTENLDWSALADRLWPLVESGEKDRARTEVELWLTGISRP